MLKEKHDIIASKDEQIKAAAAKDERILTLETTSERRDQELALKDKDILAIVSTLRSKDQKLTDLEAALRNSKPIDVVNLQVMETWTAPTSPPALLPSAPADIWLRGGNRLRGGETQPNLI